MRRRVLTEHVAHVVLDVVHLFSSPEDLIAGVKGLHRCYSTVDSYLSLDGGRRAAKMIHTLFAEVTFSTQPLEPQLVRYTRPLKGCA